MAATAAKLPPNNDTKTKNSIKKLHLKIQHRNNYYIAAISEDHKVVTIAMQSGNDQDIKDYLKEKGINFPIIVDEYGEIAKSFGVQGVPTSFVVDPQGNIDFTEVGYTTSWGLKLRLWLAEN